jgi:hypothetical protein
MRLLGSAAIYFALVFATGFVLGTVRVLLVAPRTGTRTAELLEIPIMLVAVVLAARWTTWHRAAGAGPGERLGIGLLALGWMQVAELSVGIAIRGSSPTEAPRDPVSGVVYYAALGLFALMPWLLGRATKHNCAE